MSYRGRIKEYEFKIGKGRRVADSFSMSRAWQRGYPSSRLQSPSYVAACYSTSPQAVFKIISYGSSKKNLTNLVDYLIQRDEGRVEIEGSDGLVMQDDDVADMLEDWSKDFKASGSGKGVQRHFTHMLLSADVDPTENNYQRVLETVRETAFTQFGQLGYEYKMVLHRDTDNPHVHIVLNNYNKITNKKLRLDRHDLFSIRSAFADNLSKNKLKKHISTLRQDRPEFLHRVTSELARLNKGITDLESLLVNCAYLKRSNRLDAVLNKQSDKQNNKRSDRQSSKQSNRQNDKDKNIKPTNSTNSFGFKADIRLDFDFSNGYLQLRVKDVKNRHINNALQQIAYRELHSRKFGLARDGSATLTIKDIRQLSPQVQKTVRDKFNTIIKEKIEKQMAGRSRDGLTKYKYLLKQTDTMLRTVGANKQLSFKQKSQALKELRAIRKKIIDGFDLKEIQKGSQLAKSEAAMKTYKELDDMNSKLNGKDYYNANEANTIERKIDNLLRLGAHNKNYKFANAKVVVYADKSIPNRSVPDKPMEKLKTTQREINNGELTNLIKTGVQEKGKESQEQYKFANDNTIIYSDKPKSKTQFNSKSDVFTLTLNRTQDKVFDSILVKTAQTIGSKDYELKQNPKGVSSIIIKDMTLTLELKKQIEFISKTILKREDKIQDRFNDYKKQSVLIKKTPTRREFLYRRRALESFAIRQSTQIKEAIKVFRKDKDSNTVTLLRGMLKESNYKKIIDGHKAVQNSIIQSRSGMRVGR